MESLGCLSTGLSKKVTAAGLLLFGKSSSLRRVFPLHRVDYIRVPGNDWVSDPDNRFTTVDMRGPLLLLVFRIVDAIYSDLPKGFRLEENDLQADSTGIPVKALREAITNALMHRSYRINEPIQIIRYDNRLEILNPGFSLKSEENLGSPGSVIRNPFIAAVFHETNLAETKGSGIRAMRKLMINSNLAPPTFESSRINNKFTARLLLLHLLGKADIQWLSEFDQFNLNDYQKQALVFVREVGAIDNNTYRQLSDTDALKASIELRQLREAKLLVQKGKGRGTYYIIGPALHPLNDIVDTSSNTEGLSHNTQGSAHNTDGLAHNTEGLILKVSNDIEIKEEIVNPRQALLIKELPEHVRLRLGKLKKREADPDKIKNIIEDICEQTSYTLEELSIILDKQENWISRAYIKPLIDEKRLTYTIPDMFNHPHQAYIKPK